jgi:hypothetical protein
MRQCQRLTIWSGCPAHAKENTGRGDPRLTIFVREPTVAPQKTGTHGWPIGDPGLTFDPVKWVPPWPKKKSFVPFEQLRNTLHQNPSQVNAAVCSAKLREASREGTVRHRCHPARNRYAPVLETLARSASLNHLHAKRHHLHDKRHHQLFRGTAVRESSGMGLPGSFQVWLCVRVCAGSSERERVCCLLVLNLVSSTLPCIRHISHLLAV